MNLLTENALFGNRSPEPLKTSFTRIRIKSIQFQKCPYSCEHGLSRFLGSVHAHLSVYSRFQRKFHVHTLRASVSSSIISYLETYIFLLMSDEKGFPSKIFMAWSNQKRKRSSVLSYNKYPLLNNNGHGGCLQLFIYLYNDLSKWLRKIQDL